MKKIIFIAAFLIGFFGFSQGGPKVDAIKFRGKVTTTIRDLIDVPTGETWLVHNITTNQFEWANDDDVWSVFGGSGDEWGDLVDSHIVPGTAAAYNLGSSTFPFAITYLQDIYLNENTNALDWRIVPNSGHLIFYEHDGSVWQERFRMPSGGTVSGATDVINKAYFDANSGSGGDAWGSPVDADIVPDTDSSRNLGVTGNRFLSGWFDAITSGSATIEGILNVQGRIIGDYLTLGGRSASPTGFLGNLYTDSDDNRLYFHNGTSYKALAYLDELGGSLPVDDTSPLVRDPVDNTKQVRLDVGNVPTGNTATLTISADNQFITPLSVKGNGTDYAVFPIYRDDGTTLSGGFEYNSASSAIKIINSTSSESIFLYDSGGVAIDSELSMANNKITDLTDPTSAQDAATKAYVDNHPGDITIHPDSGQTGLRLGFGNETQANAATINANDIYLCSDCPPMDVQTATTIEVDGYRGIDDRSADSGTFTFSNLKAGAIVEIEIDRATDATYSGITFVEHPDSDGFQANTEQLVLIKILPSNRALRLYSSLE